MARIRSKDTKPELAVRRHFHCIGLRYSLIRKINGVNPDLVLVRWKACIFVHGCFWHQHANCKFARIPKSNHGYWAAKFSANRKRDDRNLKKVLDAGWSCGVIWECQINNGNLYRSPIKSLLQRSGVWEI